MGFFSMLMGNPSTKAECDQLIGELQGDIERKKARIASMPNGKPGSSEACNKNQEKYQLGNLKAELAKLKAMRKTLK